MPVQTLRRETAGLVSHASRDLAQARALYADGLAEHEAMVGVLVNDWSSSKERLARLQAELLPAALNRTEAAAAAYRGGKADLGMVLAARRDALDARMQLLQLEMETARLWARLHFLVPQDVAVTGGRP